MTDEQSTSEEPKEPEKPGATYLGYREASPEWTIVLMPRPVEEDEDAREEPQA